MFNLNKTKIGPKLIGGFVIVALIALGIGLYGIFNLKKADDSDTQLYETNTTAVGQIGEILSAFHQVRVNIRDIIRTTNKETKKSKADKIEELIKIEKDNIKPLIDSSESKEETKKYNDLLAEIEKSNELMKKAQSFSDKDDMENAYTVLDGEKHIIDGKIIAELEDMKKLEVDNAKKRSEENTVNSNNTIRGMVIALAVGILIAILIGILLTNSITRPLNQGVEMMQELSNGHLGKRLKMDRTDEIGILAGVMDRFADALQGVVGVIQQIGAGDLSADVKNFDDKDEINPAIRQTILSLRGLVSEAGMLSKAGVEGRLATRGDASKFSGGYKDIVQGVNETLDAVIGPLNVAADYVDKISKGNIPQKITDNYNGDFNGIKNNLNQCVDAISGLIVEMNNMSAQHDAGDIDVKISAEQFQGAYKDMADGVNNMVFGHIAVKKKAMACIAEFGRGNFEAPLEKFPGKKVFINDTIEQVRTNLKTLIADTEMLSKAAVEGKLATRADATKHQGDFRKIVQGVNETLDAVIGPLNVAADYVDKISKGNIPQKITDSYNGDFNNIKNNLNQCVDAISGLIVEMNNMSTQHDAGDIDVKIAAEKFQGAYNVMADGVNNMVFGHIAVKKKAMACISEFGKGNFEEPLEKFPGKKVFINDTIEQVRTNLKALIADTEILSKAAVEGKLATRADATKHQGDFLKIVQGVNETLDAVIGPLNVAADYVDKISKGNIPPKITDNYNGDFNIIKGNLNTCIDAVNALVADAGLLSDAAVAGKLATRADATKHFGDFRKIVEGVNDTLDAIVVPVNEASDVLAKLASRDLTVRVVGNYQGDFSKIKDNLNNAMIALQNTVQEITAIAVTVAESAIQVSTASESVGKASQEVANGAQQVASGSTETSRSSNEAANNMEQLQRAIEEVARGAQVQATGAEQAALAAQQSQAAIKRIIEAAGNAKSDAQNAGGVAKESAAKTDEMLKSMDRVKEAAGVTSKNVNALGDASKKIGEIVEAINDIAEQTNLLALNAAIEAARAGEHGKGFAVVADEVRKLAERSAGQTKEIAALINGIKDGISEAVSSMVIGAKEIDAGVGMANQAGSALKDILTAVDKVVYQANEVGKVCVEVEQSASLVMSAVENVSSVTEEATAATEEMAASSTEVTKAIEQVAAVTEQSSATSEELSAAAEEQNALVEEMTAASKEVTNLADKVKSVLSTFKVA